jgi:hypothetical protein
LENLIQDFFIILDFLWVFFGLRCSNITATSGDKDAAKGREIVAEKITGADITKAQDLLRECLKKNFKGC